MKTRSEIDDKYKWDLSQFKVTDENFEEKCETLKTFMKKIYAMEGKLNSDEGMLKYLELNDELNALFEPVLMYVHLRCVEDLSIARYDEMEEMLNKLIIEFNQKTIFGLKHFKKLSLKKIDQLLADKRFKNWALYLEDLKEEKKHQLPDSVDKFLAGVDFIGSNNDIMEKLSDVDIEFADVEDGKGKKHELNNSTCTSYLESDDRVLRENTLKTLHGTYGKFINTFSANYINSIKEDCFFAKAYRYKSALARAMQLEKVNEKIYDILIKNVRNRLPILFEYFELKRKALGLKTLYNYDTCASLDYKSKKEYTYDEAIELIKKAVSPLGEEYVSLIQRAKDERWIDVYPNKNKRSGAFESAIYGYMPVVMANFNNELEEVFTLAHELGHAMHSYYSNKNQNREKAQYTIFLAEIASTTHELLLLQLLLREAKTDTEKLELYNNFFNKAKSSIFRQTMFAEFEEKVHALHEEGGALSKDKICDIYYNLNKDYFGDKVKLLDEVKYEWARIPHFFTAFYVYKYAIGMICAINFSSRIFSGEEGIVEKYIGFLSSGCSDKPNEILKRAECDLEKEETYEKSFEFVNVMLSEFKKLIK